MKIIFSILILLFSSSISYSKNTDIIHDFKITFDCKLEKIMIKNKDFNYQTFTADNIEVDKNKVLKVVLQHNQVNLLLMVYTITVFLNRSTGELMVYQNL